MLNVTRKIWSSFNDRYIFLRRFVISTREFEKAKQMKVFLAKENISDYRVKRVKAIDEVLEIKIGHALGDMDFDPPFDIEEAKTRLKNGHFFFIIEHKGEIIGWTWNAIHSIYIPEIEKKIELANKTTFTFNSYIHKNYRKKNLSKFLSQEKLSDLRKENLSILWSLIYTWNVNSIKSAIDLGNEIIAHYYYFRFFFIKIRYRYDLKKTNKNVIPL